MILLFIFNRINLYKKYIIKFINQLFFLFHSYTFSLNHRILGIHYYMNFNLAFL